MRPRALDPCLLVVLWLSVAGAALPPAPRAAEQDAALERFLGRHKLEDLLVVHLREKLSRAPSDRKGEAALQLAEVYASMLQRGGDKQAQEQIEQAASELLEALPRDESFELRLMLAKASYLRAEAVAEQHRLRTASPRDVEQARLDLESLGLVFSDIAQQLSQRVVLLERRQEGSQDQGLLQIKDELEEARRLHSLARYYSGWCSCYLAVLTGQERSARRALTEFGVLLGAEHAQQASPAQLQTEMLRYPHIARSALGCAMACTVLRDDAQAGAWLDLLEAFPELPPDVAEQIPARRLAVLAQAGRWQDAAALAKKRRSAVGGTLPRAEARVLMVAILDAGGMIPPALRGELLRLALSDLAAHRELAWLLDLSRSYGELPFDGEGFLPAYIRAMRAYEHARREHKQSEEPAATPQQALLYEAAALAFERAASSADAGAMREEREQVLMLRGRALFFSNHPREAATQFLELYEQTAQAQRKEEALWRAIASLERTTDDPRLAPLSELYLKQYPGSENAARIVLNTAAGRALEPMRAVDILLSVRPDSALRLPARRQAARLLLQAYRGSPAQGREETGRRFVHVAGQVMAEAVKDLESPGGEGDALAAVYARQILEVAPALSPPLLDAAGGAIGVLEQISGRTPEGVTSEEVLYHRLVVALAAGDTPVVDDHLDRLVRLKGRYAPPALQAVLRHAGRAWRDAPDEPRARRLLTLGQNLLAREQPPREAFDLTAQAAAWLWTHTDGVAERDLAITTDARALKLGLRDAARLARLARLSEAAGDIPGAQERWLELMAALPATDEAWFEARYESLRLLSRTDPTRAVEVMAQHEVLHPELGPGLWRERFEQLRGQLGK